MRFLVLGVVVFACGPPRSPPAAVPRDEPVVASRTCADAGAALERGTVGIRAPESSILAAMRTRCVDDGWSPEAIACFTAMPLLDAADRELGRCASMLPAPARGRMFDTIGSGTGDDRIALAITRARLGALTLPVPACERFVVTVVGVLSCEGIPVATRLQLGHETSDFWSLPTANLPQDAAREMADICTASIEKLQRQAQEAGCMP
jgi:hypothetical protein